MKTLFQSFTSNLRQPTISYLSQFPAILFLMLVSLFAGYGCIDKDEFKHGSGLSAIDKSAYLQYVHKQLADQEKLTTRSGDYSTTDAISFLNEGLNFMYCRPDTAYAESMFFLDSVNIPLNGSGRIDEEDLEDALEAIAEFAGDQYYAEQRSDKIPVMFNVRQISLTTGICRVQATFVMEAGPNSLTADIYPYEEEWIYGQWGQDVSEECNELEVNADAADLFRRDLRKSLVMSYRSKFGSPYYFKNPYTVCFSPASNQCLDEEIPFNFFPPDEVVESWELINGDDPTDEDNFVDYLLFHNYAGFSNFHECLTDNEMNFHYSAMYDLALGVLPSPSGLNVISQIEVGYELLLGTFSRIHHGMVVTRATKLFIIDDEYEFALPLPN